MVKVTFRDILLQQVTPPKPLQMVPPTGTRVFNYMSLWRDILFKTPHDIYKDLENID